MGVLIIKTNLLVLEEIGSILVARNYHFTKKDFDYTVHNIDEAQKETLQQLLEADYGDSNVEFKFIDYDL